jgi:GAF domain-containing protein
MPDDTHINLNQTIAELRRELDARTIERDEAVARETAIAQVLGLINSSPADLAPVFDAMLEKATRLAEASFGILMSYDGESFRTVALHGVPNAYAEYLRGPIRSSPLNGLGRLLSGERLIHIADITADKAYAQADPLRKATAELGGSRTHLLVPLLKDGSLLGTFVIYRQEVRPFSDKQIALLQNFAAQAVIAMENARLLNELRDRTRNLQESLEYQTATSDVLKVISRSPFELQPVLRTLAESAARLCEAGYGAILRRDGEVYRMAATVAFSPDNMAAARHYQEFLEAHPLSPGRGSITGRVALEGRAVHIIDCDADPEYTLTEATALGHLRTQLGVPLLRQGSPIGVICLGRQYVEPFTEKQIELVTTFADQAVIAIENARLLTETREALEQQTAAAEVLQVINASPGDLSPVFDSMLEKALRLCGGSFGELRTYDGERFSLAATHGVPTAYVQHYARGDRGIYGPGTGPPRILAGERVVHISDLLATEPYQRGDPDRVALVELGGARAYLLVPLLKDGAVLGYIMIYRKEVGTFSDTQIALLQNFATQAVIAMENARLLGELQQRTGDLQESLEYQTATSDVLKVISRSTFDLQPVLQTVLDTAVRLCRAGPSEIFRMEGDGYRFAVGHGMTPEYEVLERTVVIHPDPGTLVGRTALERRAVHVLDAWTDPLYSQKEEARIGNFHTMLGVPLMREGEVAGVIALSRRAVEPFSEREIQLVTTFADQAVIAIENARLLNELQDRTGDLQEWLEYQTATSDVLKVISRSTFDLQPVLDTLVETAARLCNAEMGLIANRDGDSYPVASSFAFSPEFEELVRKVKFEPGRGTVTGRAALERQVVHASWPMRSTPCPKSSRLGKCERHSACHCCVRASRSGLFISPANGCSRLPTGRSSWCAPLPTRPSLRSRIRGC